MGASGKGERTSDDIASLDDEKRHRRALKLVSEKLITVNVPLENRKVYNRLLPGLWYATVTILLAALEKDDLLALFASRRGTIVGHGDNADCGAKVLSQKELGTYVTEVEAAAETIVDKLMEAEETLEAEDLDGYFPEAVLDAGLLVLLPAWGPDHVRSAIDAQSASLIRGEIHVADFREPAKLISARPRKSKAAETVADEIPVLPTDAPTLPAPLPQIEPTILNRVSIDRKSHVFLISSISESVPDKSLWCLTMRTEDAAGRVEYREISGQISDPTGRKAAARCIEEAICAIAFDTGRAQVVLETTSDAIYSLLSKSNDGDDAWRGLMDEQRRAEIESAFSYHEFKTRLVGESLSDDLQERANRMLLSSD